MPEQLIKEVLPRLFKHDKMSSFGRQLNVSSPSSVRWKAILIEGRFTVFLDCFLEDNSRILKAMFRMRLFGLVSDPPVLTLSFFTWVRHRRRGRACLLDL